MISTDQNKEKQLQRLAAQRQLYATAKKVFCAQLLLGGPVAVATALLVIAYPELKGYVALWGILIALSDIFWLTPWQKRLCGAAALIQEAFDCDVLSLPWNDLKAGNRPDPELIKEQADKYQSWAAQMPPLTDWYAPTVDDVPLYIGRIACEHSNCWWDAKQRRRYAAWIITTLTAVIIFIFLLALRNGLTVEDFVLKVAAPLAPAVLLGVRQFRDQVEAASRLDKLKEHAERLWHDALAGKPDTEVSAMSRALQDEILENRRKSPLVFDYIYKKLQRDYELQMNHGVTELVTEAKNTIGGRLTKNP